MKEAALIFLGGGAGSVLRFYIGRWTNQVYPLSFPMGTLAANVLACLTLGIIIGLADQKNAMSADARLFWTVGFCGGFSTFSTFSQETLNLLQAGLTFVLALYAAASLVVCVAAVCAGIWLGHQLTGS